MRRSPVSVGFVLGAIVGAAATGAIALTGPGSGSPRQVFYIFEPTFRAPAGGRLQVGAQVLVQGRLPDLRGRARGYRLGSEPATGAIERLAAALDIHGVVRRDAGGWVAREANRLVSVRRDAGLPWFFSTFEGPCREVPGTPAPAKEVLPPVAPPGPTDCPDTAAAPSGPQAAPAANLLGREDALAFGMETLGRAGLGVSRTAIVEQTGGWHIEAAPAVNGTPTSGFGWTITIGRGGRVTAASGFLARPEPVATYPLVGTAKALERLKRSTPVPAPALPRCPTGAPCSPPTPLVLNVTGVLPGLIFGDLGGMPYLVPAYLFELEGRPPPVVPVLAV